MPTLSYFAGVPADLTPAIRSNRLAASAGAAATLRAIATATAYVARSRTVGTRYTRRLCSLRRGLRVGGHAAVVARPAFDQHQAQHQAEDREPGPRRERRREALRQSARQLALRAVRGRHHVVGARDRDRRQDREPERAADLLRRV